MPSNPCSAIVLAGGLATRLGGIDKALLPLAGQPLITHVLKRLTPQVDDIVINCNRNQETLAALGHPTVPDAQAGHPGPLAGIVAALPLCRHDIVLVAPCDTPFLPVDLVARLLPALEAGGNLAIVHDGVRLQPLIMLLRRDLAGSLETWLRGGNRKVELWCRAENAAVVQFDDAAPFINLNTAEELAKAEQKLGG